MEPFYYCRSEQYSKMANMCYAEFLRLKTFYDSGKFIVEDDVNGKNIITAINLSQKIDENYIGAIVFEAMAIESYVNLMGAYLTDEEAYYEQCKELPIRKKIEYVASSLNKKFPEGLKWRIQRLFNKRNDLVHQKPRAFTFDIEAEDRNVLLKKRDELLKEMSSNLKEKEMSLYEELKSAVKTMRQSKYELLDEIRLKDEGEK